MASHAAALKTIPAQSPQTNAGKASQRRPLNWFERVFVLILVVAGLVVTGPWIVAGTPLRHRVLNWIVPELPAGTMVSSAQFGWLSPVLLNGLILKDDEGRQFFSAESITSSASLLDLVKNPGKLGEFEIVKPVVNIVVDKKGSNLSALGERLGKKPPKGFEPEVAVKLKDGTVTFSDPSGQKLAELTDLQAAYATVATADPNHKVELACKVTHPIPDGSVAVAGQWHFIPKTRESHGGELTAKIQGFPLDMLQPALAESLHLASFAGVTDVDLQTKLVPIDGGALATEVDFRIPRVQFEAIRQGEAIPIRWANKSPIEFTMRGQIDPPKQIADLQSFALRSEMGNLRMQGRISDWDRDVLCDITGDLDYDLKLLLERLPPNIQREIQLEGLQIRNFIVKGPVKRLAPPQVPTGDAAIPAPPGNKLLARTPGEPSAPKRDAAAPNLPSALPPAPLPGTPGSRPSGPIQQVAASVPALEPAPTPAAPLPPVQAVPAPEVQIAADLSWKMATVFGVQSNNGLMRVSTQNNVVALDAVRVPVSTGRFQARPQIPLDQQPYTLYLGSGPILEDVEMTEEMCRTWLQYIAPLISNATAVDGRFSLTMDQAILPLDGPGKGSASGKLLMQQGRVGPGPIADEILKGVGTILQISGGQLNPDAMVWMNMPRQEIAFQMKEGRMSHGLVVFNIGGVAVTSQGSVGTVDRTLDLLVDFRLPDEWLNRGPLLATLKGEGLQLHVGGTLDKPLIDNKPLLEFGRRAAVKAGAGAILDLIKRRQERRGLR